MARLLKRFWLISLILILFFFPWHIIYADEEELPDAETYLEEIVEALPEDAEDLLPEGESYSEMAKNGDTGYLLSLSVTFLKKAITTSLESLSIIFFVIFLGIVADRIEKSFDTLGNNLASFLSVLAISFCIFEIIYDLYLQCKSFCDSVSAYMMTTNGVMTTVSLLGGGVMESSGRTLALSTTVSVLGSVIGILMLPIIRLSFASSVTSSFSDKLNLSSLGSFLKGLFTFILGFLSMIAVVALTFQTSLAQAEDTFAARTIRYAASNSIPIVGGAVSDSVRTLAASVGMIKKSVGTIGVTGLISMALYPLASLFSAKITFILSKTVAGIAGVTAMEALLDEAGKIVNMLIAAISIISVLYIFVIALFSLSAVPIG